MIYDNDVKYLIAKKAKEIGEFIGKTLGPNGKNIAIVKENIYFINDGYSVCNSLEFDDPYSKIALKLLLEGARLTSEMANDGTTSTICLASELIYNFIEIFGDEMNNEETYELIRIIERHSLKVIDESTISISSKLNANKDISVDTTENRKYLKAVLKSTMGDNLSDYFELLINAIGETSDNGVINLRPTYDELPSYEMVNGFVYEKGFVSQYLGLNGIVILNRPYVILVNDSIKTINELEEIIYEVKKTKNDLFIIANSFSKEVIDYIIYMKNNNRYNICASISPEYGEKQIEKLDDLAIYLNTNVISNKNISITMDTIGKADRIEITKDRTIIFKENINEKNINDRIQYIKSINKENIYGVNKYMKERIGALKGKIIYINIPTKKDYEYELNLQKIKNGISSCLSSLDKGIVNGSFYVIDKISRISKEELVQYGFIGRGDLLNKIIKFFSSFKVILRFACYNEIYKGESRNSVWDSAYYTKVICLNAIYVLKLFINIDGVFFVDKPNKDASLEYI